MLTEAAGPAGRDPLSGFSVLEPRGSAAASLSEAAYLSIRDRIVSLRLKPGSMIDERALMQELEVGRTPVREALRRLAVENLVEIFPRRGIFVAGVDITDLASISEFRTELEGFAARLAASRATPPQRRTCEELIAELDTTRGESDVQKLIHFDQRIHHHVYRCAHNSWLESVLEEHFVLTLRLWFLVLDKVTRLVEAVQEHKDILEAIRDEDGDRAEAVMRGHVAGFEEAIRKVL